MGRYDIAQICLNGHVVNDMYDTFPEDNQPFCEKCGAKTINSCLKCENFIRGSDVPDQNDAVMIIPGGEYKRPSFCKECGKAYPWTEENVKAAKELAMEIEELSDKERVALTNIIDGLIVETPRTGLESTRFKKVMLKVGEESKILFRKFLIDIVAETAKRQIWGQ